MLDNKGNDCEKSKIIQIYSNHYGLMMRTAKDILCDHALAEDAVSDSIEKMLKIADKIDDVFCNKTKALIVIIVRNTSLNILKKLSRADLVIEDTFDLVFDNSPDVLDAIISKQNYEELVDVIHELPTALKEVVVLSLLCEVDQAKIAEILGISYGTVRTRLSRARSLLRNKLTGSENNGKR